MKDHSKRALYFLICIGFIITAFSVTVSADTGPKASVRVNFENMGDETCYATLLSEEPSTGPYTVWNGEDDQAYHNGNEYYYYVDSDYETWRAFVEYEDVDGYYFLQEAIWKVNETKELAWTYYPPDTFKILLYFPKTGNFAVSGICERYAFDTYYTVDMAGVDIDSVDYNEELSSDNRLNAYKSYRWQQEALSLVARIFITIAIETCIALLFGLRGRKSLLLLVIVNTATQIILNVLLNVIRFNSGHSAFISGYIILELLIFAIEAALYCIMKKMLNDRPKKNWFYAAYALIANAVSFVSGLIVAEMLPGIF